MPVEHGSQRDGRNRDQRAGHCLQERRLFAAIIYAATHAQRLSRNGKRRLMMIPSRLGRKAGAFSFTTCRQSRWLPRDRIEILRNATREASRNRSDAPVGLMRFGDWNDRSRRADPDESAGLARNPAILRPVESKDSTRPCRLTILRESGEIDDDALRSTAQIRFW